MTKETTSSFPDPEKVLITIVPFFFKHFKEKFITSIVIILLRIESKDLFPVEFSAISESTRSNFLSLMILSKSDWTIGFVKSPLITLQFLIFSIPVSFIHHKILRKKYNLKTNSKESLISEDLL